jgi:KaiC/GvpD/RAD55 family RecA-like ATPase
MSGNESRIIKTFISPVHYRLPAEGARGEVRDLPQIAVSRDSSGSSLPLYWLDALLGGGLRIPANEEGESLPFVLLLAGQPGSGKSTFALELCYNLARFPQDDGSTLRSIYYSSESTSDRIIEHVRSFGWDDAGRFRAFRQGERVKSEACTICGTEVLNSEFYRDDGRVGASPSEAQRVARFFEVVRRTWLRGVAAAPAERVLGDPQVQAGDGGTGFQALDNPEPLPPDVVVIDSLNVMSGGTDRGREQIFEEFLRFRNQTPTPKLLVLVVDGYRERQPASTWEYIADGAIRFDSLIGDDGYFQRTFQVMKIKTQSHVLGKQVFKIYQGPDEEHPGGKPAFSRTDVVPYLATGGTYVFPSVHWHLSASGLKNYIEFQRDRAYSSGLPKLDSLLANEDHADKQGFPAHCTTALVGSRGGMKSHLAYSFLLRHALGPGFVNDDHPKNVLLVSLRDDLDGTKKTLQEIAREERLATPNGGGGDVVQELIDADRLEIIYNRPGCISPNEMFHRLFVALARRRAAESVELGDGSLPLKRPQRDTAEVVVVNGLDHLQSRFPLCSRERMFVPAIISLFRKHKVCLVIASSGGGEGGESAAAEADLVLNFDPIADGPQRAELVKQIPQCTGVIQQTKVTAVRVPEGQIGGRWGVLGRCAGQEMYFFPSP